MLRAAFELDDSRWALLSRESLATLEQTMRTEIRPEQMADARRVLPRFVSRELTTDETMLASELVKGFVAANSLPNLGGPRRCGTKHAGRSPPYQ